MEQIVTIRLAKAIGRSTGSRSGPSVASARSTPRWDTPPRRSPRTRRLWSARLAAPLGRRSRPGRWSRGSSARSTARGTRPRSADRGEAAGNAEEGDGSAGPRWVSAQADGGQKSGRPRADQRPSLAHDVASARREAWSRSSPPYTRASRATPPPYEQGPPSSCWARAMAVGGGSRRRGLCWTVRAGPCFPSAERRDSSSSRFGARALAGDPARCISSSRTSHPGFVRWRVGGRGDRFGRCRRDGAQM